MDKTKDNFAVISIRRTTHARLKALAEQNHVSLVSYLEDMVARIDQNEGSPTVRLDRIELFLKDLNSHFLELNANLNKLDLGVVSIHQRYYPFSTQAEINKDIKRQDKEWKKVEADEQERKEAVAAGEIPDRQRGKRSGIQKLIGAPPVSPESKL